MKIPHKIELPEGYTQDLRRAVKQNKSNAWLYKLLSDIYKAGYLQAVRDYTQKINEEIDAINSANLSNDNDGVELPTDSSIVGASQGLDADDADSSEGSAEPESVVAE